MKKILLISALLALTGCDKPEPAKKNYHLVSGGVMYDIYCIRGVQYIVINGAKKASVTPLLQADGSITTCLKEEVLDGKD